MQHAGVFLAFSDPCPFVHGAAAKRAKHRRWRWRWLQGWSHLKSRRDEGENGRRAHNFMPVLLHNEVNPNHKSRRLFRFRRRELLSLLFIVGVDASHSFIGRFLPYGRSPLIRNPTILTLVLCSATTTTNPVGNIVRSLPSFHRHRSQFDGLLDSGTVATPLQQLEGFWKEALP